MPYCPKCGKETGNARFCPECGAPQGSAGTATRYSEGRKEPYNSWIGAVLCCCLCPVTTFLYYYMTEPNEDSLNDTFMRVAAICGIGIVFLVVFSLFMIFIGGDLLGL